MPLFHIGGCGLCRNRLATLETGVTQYGDVTAHLRIPLGPVVYFMSALSVLAAIGFLLAAVWQLLGRKTSSDPAQNAGFE